MNMKRLLMLALVAVLSLTFALTAAASDKKEASSEPQKWWFHDVVDYNFVKENVKIPRVEGVMIIDSRPYETKFINGYIPSAVSIPQSKFDKMTDKLPADKNALLIFYCGGFHCKLSHKGAKAAEKLGYKNVKVYAAGFPDYKKNADYYSVGVEYVKNKLAKGENYMLIDARPAKKYLDGAIPSSVSMPDSKFEDKKGLLPADKESLLIYYCGGFKCKLSHKSTKKALALGYKKVVVAEAGYPGWKKLYGGANAVAIQDGGVEGAIDVEQFKKILAEKPDSIMLIDVRDADEFEQGHYPTAVHMPVDELEKKITELPTDKPIVFVCSTGARSGEAFYMVQDMRPEIKKVYYLEAEVTFKKDGTATIKVPEKP